MVRTRFAVAAVLAAIVATMCVGCKAYADEAALNLLKDSAAALSQRDYYTIDMNGDMDLSINMGQAGASATLDIKGNAQGLISYQAEPFAVEFAVNGSADLAGQQNASANASAFVVENGDGTGTMYGKTVVNGEDSGWHVDTIDEEQFAQFKSSMTSEPDFDNLTNLVGEMTNAKVQGVELFDMFTENMVLEPESSNIRGYDCNMVSCVIDGSSILSVADVPDATVNEIFGGIKCDIRTSVDTNSHLPVQSSIDLSGSDFSDLAAMFTSVTSESDDEVTVSVENRSFGVTVDYDYDAPAVVIVPDEAKQAEQFMADLEPADDNHVQEPAHVGSESSEGSLGTDMPERSPDGSYVMPLSQGEDVSIMLPDGFNATYVDYDYFAADTEDYLWSVYYTTEYYSSMEDEVALLTDDSFYTKSGYTDFEVRTETPLQTASGRDAFAVARKYKSGDMVYVDTCIMVDCGDYLIVINTSHFDDGVEPLEITQEEMQMFADSVL